ncbi:reverse transcriptase [Candidatus Poribacteria bacterium]|nr:reverse transcriptase [Gammaproteobacteria bacterium]MYF97868.1 reverse transcriptase [Candidatus Poribacteria bacterium]
MLKLNESSLDWALAHCLQYGDTDVFPLPFEYAAIENDWERVRSYLGREDICQWLTRPHRTLLSPKAKYGLRAITQLDPLDSLVFGAIIREIAEKIESKRSPITDRRVFSYRVELKDQGQLFSSDIGYRQFLDECRSRVQSGKFEYVAITDISDFYSRIYLHRMENALGAACDSGSHVMAIKKLLAGWNGTESYGLPVGSAFSRLLAEITISDIDDALQAHGVDFVRFNDDYRIFVNSISEAYQSIVILAEFLFRNHGLSLQPQKTNILTIDKFQADFLATPLDREVNSLYQRFEELVNELGLNSWYDLIEYDDLTPEQQEQIDALNLVELFREEIGREEPEIPVLRFILRRLGQLGDDSIVDDIFGSLDSIYPAFVDVVRYLGDLRFLNTRQKSDVGNKLLELLENSIVSELTYHRMWIVNMFTHSTEWDNEDKFVAIYNLERDQVTRRELILAMGRSQQRHWFQSQWRSILDHPDWSRRALIAGASCLQSGARKHLYRSLTPRLDPLEFAVMKWAKENPFFV